MEMHVTRAATLGVATNSTPGLEERDEVLSA
jgi:hypothetical protein